MFVDVLRDDWMDTPDLVPDNFGAFQFMFIYKKFTIHKIELISVHFSY